MPDYNPLADVTDLDKEEWPEKPTTLQEALRQPGCDKDPGLDPNRARTHGELMAILAVENGQAVLTDNVLKVRKANWEAEQEERWRYKNDPEFRRGVDEGLDCLAYAEYFGEVTNDEQAFRALKKELGLPNPPVPETATPAKMQPTQTQTTHPLQAKPLTKTKRYSRLLEVLDASPFRHLQTTAPDRPSPLRDVFNAEGISPPQKTPPPLSSAYQAALSRQNMEALMRQIEASREDQPSPTQKRKATRSESEAHSEKGSTGVGTTTMVMLRCKTRRRSHGD